MAGNPLYGVPGGPKTVTQPPFTAFSAKKKAKTKTKKAKKK